MRILKTFTVRLSLDIEEAETLQEVAPVTVHVPELVPQDYRKPDVDPLIKEAIKPPPGGIYSVIKPELSTDVPDAVVTDTGACLVPFTEGRIGALAASGQDVTGIRPGFSNPDGWDVNGEFHNSQKSERSF
jgi:hypothetical protein